MRQQAKEWRGEGRGPGRRMGHVAGRSGSARYGAAMGLVFALTAGVSAHAALNAPPDKAAAYAGTGITSVAVSPDGRIVAGLESSTTARIFDAYNVSSFGSTSVSTPATLTDCTSPVGIFVSSTGIVHVPCADGALVQLTVTENTLATGLATLSASESTVIKPETTLLTSITAATMDADGTTLYVVGKFSSSLAPEVVTFDATRTGASLVKFSQMATDVTISRVSLMPSGSLLMADSTGALHSATTSGVVSNFVSCELGPKDLLVLDSSRALLLGGTNTVSVIELNSDAAITCTAYDWGMTTVPTSMARVETNSIDGDYIYMNGAIAGGGDFAAYAVADIAKADLEPAPDINIATELSGTTVMAAAGELGQIFVGGSSGLTVLSAGPVFSLSSLSAPLVVTDDSSTVSLTLTSDETVTDGWYDLEEPSSSSVTGPFELGETLTAGIAVDLELDLASLTLETGLNTVFLYGQDADGNTGWTTVRVNYVNPPATLENFEVLFGDGKLYLKFDAPDDETIDGYEILLSQQEFTAPDSELLPEEWYDEDGNYLPPSFTVGTTSYPGSSGWPLELEATTETDVWSEVDGQLTYELSPLTNGTTYYVTIRGTASGVGGEWATVLSGMPEETCGAACISEDLGGFCSIAPAHTQPRGTSSPLLIMGMMVGARLLWRRRQTARAGNHAR